MENAITTLNDKGDSFTKLMRNNKRLRGAGKHRKINKNLFMEHDPCIPKCKYFYLLPLKVELNLIGRDFNRSKIN
jgi:hypothetical protein